ncbi:MAG: hemerythrin domain-containing protein [Bacteroidales bacterium]|jgi:regulator of cell morphogenesis and NO signaling|nr:hemerythrin domain-containing protein [Bacteroidales bacterium]
MRINKDLKMAEVIHMNHHLLPVLNRFDIYLGFGERTVEVVCKDHKINLNFFLEIVNTFHDPTYFPLRHLQSFKASMLIEYLRKTHSYYLDVKIPEIGQYISEIVQCSGFEENHRNLVKNFFDQYRRELTNHINKEEQGVYPYVLRLEKVLDSPRSSQETFDDLHKYSINEYEEDHDDVESKLFDLKNILIKYLPPVSNYKLLNLILHEIFELESDLNNHGHIEDLILVPIVENMEKEFHSRFANHGSNV